MFYLNHIFNGFFDLALFLITLNIIFSRIATQIRAFTEDNVYINKKYKMACEYECENM